VKCIEIWEKRIRRHLTAFEYCQLESVERSKRNIWWNNDFKVVFLDRRELLLCVVLSKAHFQNHFSKSVSWNLDLMKQRFYSCICSIDFNYCSV